MEFRTPTVSPLRQRMLDDMRMRKLEPKTQAGYLRAVRHLAVFLKASPDTATVEDLRRFQLHRVDRGTSPITLNATITGLKFFAVRQNRKLPKWSATWARTSATSPCSARSRM